MKIYDKATDALWFNTSRNVLGRNLVQQDP
jgi:hypothetical protein